MSVRRHFLQRQDNKQFDPFRNPFERNRCSSREMKGRYRSARYHLKRVQKILQWNKRSMQVRAARIELKQTLRKIIALVRHIRLHFKGHELWQEERLFPQVSCRVYVTTIWYNIVQTVLHVSLSASTFFMVPRENLFLLFAHKSSSMATELPANML